MSKPALVTGAKRRQKMEASQVTAIRPASTRSTLRVAAPDLVPEGPGLEDDGPLDGTAPAEGDGARWGWMRRGARRMAADRRLRAP